MEKNELEKLVMDGLSIRKIAKVLDKEYTTIRYWLNKHNLKTDGYEKSNNWREKSLLDAINKSECKSDVLRFLNISINSGNFQTLDRYIKKYQIDDTNLVYDKTRGHKWENKYTNEEVFCENSPIGGGGLKKRILKNKFLDYKCSGDGCGIIDIWNGKIIMLQLDHKNGINNDNRIENLRFLCPNCHSQTGTFCVGNKKVS